MRGPRLGKCVALGSALVAAALCAGSGWSQAEPQEPTLEQRLPEGPTLRITSREVLLDVVATDRFGHPIKGLKASDFKITEEGTPQRIESVQEHSATSAADEAKGQMPALPPNTFTNYEPIPTTNAYTVILLDALDTRIEDQMMVRHQLIQYLKKMQPGTPVALFQMDLQMRLVQGFTTDPKVLLAAAESKRNWPSMLKPIHGSREQYILATNESLQDGFRIMGRYLAGFPGRKNLIWLTGAVPGTGTPEMDIGPGSIGNPFEDDLTVMGQDPNHLMDALTLSRVAVYPIDARGLTPPPMFDASHRSAPAPTSFMNWQANLDAEHTFMSSVAQATGGKAYYNNNGLDKQIAQIIDDGSNYYTIAYATTNQKWDGEFRRIKVMVDKPGVSLLNRPGYFAVDRTVQEQKQLATLRRKGFDASRKSYDAGSAEGVAVAALNAPDVTSAGGAVIRGPRAGFDDAMRMGAIPPTEIVIAAHVDATGKVTKLDRNAPLPKDNYLRPDFKDKPFRNYLVSVRADTERIRFTRTADGVRHANVDFVIVVYTQTGQTVNSLRTTAQLDVKEAEYRKLQKTGVGVVQEIAVPVKGSYFVRIGVHDLGSDRMGALQIATDQVRDEAQNAPPAKP